jgi:uncharacterized protein
MSTAAAQHHGRYDHIDALRALALLGVIVMNVGAMVLRWAGESLFARAAPADLAAMMIDLLVLQGKARSCFAFLFGLGFALMLQGSAAKGPGFQSFFMRRMLALLGFGIINQLFFFWGDILVTYALLGMVLLLFRDSTDKTLFKLGLLLIIIPPIAAGIAEAVSGAPLPNLLTLPRGAEAASGLAAYTSPNYWDAVAHNAPQNILRYATATSFKIIYDLNILGLFLIGAWTARRGLLFEVEKHRPQLRRVARWCLPLGLALSAISATRLGGLKAEGVLYGVVTASYVGIPILAFGYIAGLTLLLSRTGGWLRGALAPAGRMALTNYLASGAIGGWFFYGYGLGKMGEMSLLGLNIFALGLFAALAVFSHLWLGLFRFGPAEWLWRCLSYGQWQPIARRRKLAAEAYSTMR